MKNFWKVLIGAMLVMSLAACGGGSDDDDDDGDDDGRARIVMQA